MVSSHALRQFNENIASGMDPEEAGQTLYVGGVRESLEHAVRVSQRTKQAHPDNQELMARLGLLEASAIQAINEGQHIILRYVQLVTGSLLEATPETVEAAVVPLVEQAQKPLVDAATDAVVLRAVATIVERAPEIFEQMNAAYRGRRRWFAPWRGRG